MKTAPAEKLETIHAGIVESRIAVAGASTEKRVRAGAKRLSPREVLEAMLIRQGIDIDHPTPGKRPEWVRCVDCKIPVKNASTGGRLRSRCDRHLKQRKLEQKRERARRAYRCATPEQRERTLARARRRASARQLTPAQRNRKRVRDRERRRTPAQRNRDREMARERAGALTPEQRARKNTRRRKRVLTAEQRKRANERQRKCYAKQKGKR